MKKKTNIKFNFPINEQYIIVALAVVFVLCVISLFMSAPNNKANVAIEEIAELSRNIHDVFNKKPDYWGLNTKYIIDNNLSKDSMINNDKLISSLGNEVLVGGTEDGDIAMPGNQSFYIVYKNVSRKDCVILSSYNLDYAEKIGLLGITIKNTHESTSFSWGGENKLPLSVMQAKNNCLSNENTIIWSFH